MVDNPDFTDIQAPHCPDAEQNASHRPWSVYHPPPADGSGETWVDTGVSGRMANDSEPVPLRQIAGLTYGEDPRQGFFEGNTFYHPGMRFQLEFPEGWQTQNTPSAVVALSPKQDAIIQLGLFSAAAAMSRTTEPPAR